MTDASTAPSKLPQRLLNFANNPLTVLGFVLTTVSGLLIITFLVVEAFGALHNPYIGVFAYAILPGFFVLGLLVMPVGMLLQRRRLLRSGVGDRELAAYPRLDFNDPRLRRVATVVLVLTAVNAVILGASSFLAVETMETVTFCGETCHTVMQPEFTAYQESPHSRVACVQCHIGPGASWFVRSKLDGLRQVWHTLANTYHRPISTPIHTLRPARETCEQCHWPAKHHGDKLRVFARYGTDETSSPSYTVMLLKTGGGRLDLGSHGGIHWWHIESDNRIRYLSVDDKREEITWVELTTPEGEVVSYTRDGSEGPTEAEKATARTMDCVDCHNRPTHFFVPPAKALDQVLDSHGELRELPYFKKVAMAAIEAGYPSHTAGVDGVHAAILSHYRAALPALAAEQADLAERAAEEASRVYGRSFFPAMETDWTTHPSHIGHDDFPGCWRCHDGEMVSTDGARMIPPDCETCHVILLEDSPTLPDLEKLQLEG